MRASDGKRELKFGVCQYQCSVLAVCATCASDTTKQQAQTVSIENMILVDRETSHVNVPTGKQVM